MSLSSIGGQGDVVVTIYKNIMWKDDEDESDTNSDCPKEKDQRKESNSSLEESINGNGGNSNKQLDIKRSVGGQYDDDEEHEKESSCGQRFFGRADIFRPILTSEERSMLGICGIPSYFLRDKSASSYLDKEKETRDGKESAEAEYFVLSSGTIKSDLRRQRDELLETMRHQKEIDLQARKDKEVVKKLHNFKVKKVRKEYKVLTKNN